MARIKMYSGFERFWHWSQAILIILLAITGFEIHGSFKILGFETSVRLHTFAAWALIVLIVFAIFWHFTTDMWRQYIPTKKYLTDQVKYYLHGIFVNAPHPTHKTRYTKFNPLQKLTYLQLKILAFPVQIITGFIYLYADSRVPIIGVDTGNVDIFAILHTVGAYFFVIFLVVHIYLTTTGTTITSNIKAMITGWEDEEEENTDIV